MTERYHTLAVVLERDVREDDAEALITAIRMLRGVLSVKGVASDYDSHMAQERARADLGSKLLDVVYPERRKSS